MEEVFKFLRTCVTYYIATTEGDQPRVRPFSSLVLFEGKIYIESSHSKAFAHQLEKNPKVEICAFDNTSRWVRIACTLVDDPRVAPKKALLDYMPEIRDLGYDEHDPDMAVYYLHDATATFYSYSEPPRQIHF